MDSTLSEEEITDFLTIQNKDWFKYYNNKDWFKYYNMDIADHFSYNYSAERE
jgi:hypothetical protein